MTTTFIVELSEAELKALQYVAYDANTWIQTAVHERCRMAMDEMVDLIVKEKLNAGLPITETKEQMVINSTLPSAKERHETNVALAMAGPIAV